MTYLTDFLSVLLGRLARRIIALADRYAAQAHRSGAWEADELLTPRNSPTVPNAPPRPDIERDADDLRPTTRPCCPPPAMTVRPERRVIVVDGKEYSVTPDVGCYWQVGGSS